MMRTGAIVATAVVGGLGVAGAVLKRRRGREAPSFVSRFEVRAPLEAVARFYADPRALKRLTPPPTLMRIHRLEPMGEGSVSDFTMWVGPIPIRWRAVHSQFDRLRGFTDTQERGPMARWVHRHSYRALAADRTEVNDQIWYRHPDGWRGWATRLLFSKAPLRLLFAYRAWATRRALGPRASRPGATGPGEAA
jgi:ligand-binding SRPBCC domain-containing protein